MTHVLLYRPFICFLNTCAQRMLMHTRHAIRGYGGNMQPLINEVTLYYIKDTEYLFVILLPFKEDNTTGNF